MVVVERIPVDAWKPLSEKAHLICFNEHKPVSEERIDFALIAKKNHDLCGYITCRELDGRSLYWQYGGAFPGTKGSSLSFQSYKAFADWASTRYDRIATLVENTNIVMLKMAFKVGYRIVGIRNFKGHILCELLLEFEK